VDKALRGLYPLGRPVDSQTSAQPRQRRGFPRLFHRLLGIALALPLLSGCSTLITAAYLLQPADVPAEYAGLKGKHVAVVCKPIVELEFSDAGSSRELASLVGGQLQQAVRKVKVIGQHEVARWIDENAWVDYPTLGKALDKLVERARATPRPSPGPTSTPAP